MSFETKPTICLNMIVKNEEHIIVSTLQNLCSYIKFDYWVISDTGSTDNTKQLIIDFFNEQNIPGELKCDEWKDFGYNRSTALEHAYNKTDYLLIFDADDKIIGNFMLPSDMTKDSYYLKFGEHFTYRRTLLINNRKIWHFKGVLHEYIECTSSKTSSSSIEGDYYILSGRVGNRSKNTNKYYDDAVILQNAFDVEYNSPSGDKFLAYRYAFYCAQSYKDAGEKYYLQSIEWYKKVTELENWTQEKYVSCIKLGEMYIYLNDIENAIYYFIKSSDYDTERIEGITEAMRLLQEEKSDHTAVNKLYHQFKHYKKHINSLSNKLFVYRDKYNDLIEYYNSISAFYTTDKESGYECCKQIITNKIINDLLLNTTVKNIMFYNF
jgi:tetratricopeptide (TPR) repeat protein